YENTFDFGRDGLPPATAVAQIKTNMVANDWAADLAGATGIVVRGKTNTRGVIDPITHIGASWLGKPKDHQPRTGVDGGAVRGELIDGKWKFSFVPRDGQEEASSYVVRLLIDTGGDKPTAVSARIDAGMCPEQASQRLLDALIEAGLPGVERLGS